MKSPIAESLYGIETAEYGPHPPPKRCGCGDCISRSEREIDQLHKLFRAGAICESTYRRELEHLQRQLAPLSRTF